MQLNATRFRKHLFEVLDHALQGEPAEITYKGAILRLTRPPGGSKLAGAVRRDALLVDPQVIVESDADLLADLDKSWRNDDKTL